MLEKFISKNQLTVLKANIKKEEGEFFKGKLKELEDLIKGMAKTYEQDGEGDNAIVYLHYFYRDSDWYITEKDFYEDEPQYQAFGYAKIGNNYPELGYISIEDLINLGAELDLYFEPKSLGEVKKEL